MQSQQGIDQLWGLAASRIFEPPEQHPDFGGGINTGSEINIQVGVELALLLKKTQYLGRRTIRLRDDRPLAGRDCVFAAKGNAVGVRMSPCELDRSTDGGSRLCFGIRSRLAHGSDPLAAQGIQTAHLEFLEQCVFVVEVRIEGANRKLRPACDRIAVDALDPAPRE